MAVYGGYFGAGLGILLMAALSVADVKDVQEANALKNVLAAIISAIAIAVFFASNLIALRETVVVLIGAVAGGFVGARVIRQVPPTWIRCFVVAIGAMLSVYYWL